MSSYFVDAAAARAEYEANKEFYDNFIESFLKTLDMDESEFLSRKYRIYGVDNDFDLIEAMWEADRRSTGDLLSEPWFIDFRIRCAMNPEYTEKCLESRAFYDVKDEILRRLSCNEESAQADRFGC